MQLLPDPPISGNETCHGAIAQLGERLLCKQEVIGSIPIGSTSTTTSRDQQSASRARGKLIGDSSRNRRNNRLLFNNLDMKVVVFAKASCDEA